MTASDVTLKHSVARIFAVALLSYSHFIGSGY